MLAEGQQIELAIEKVAAGGSTIGRHHGQVVLVRGAIPGERVTVWIDRAEKHVAYANTREILDPSPDRRVPPFDPRCGGALFAHVAYERQLALKAQIVEDAFARVARAPLSVAPSVAASPEGGYRMRARLHVQGDRVGFYREGSHQLCDASATRQLAHGAVEAAASIARTLHRHTPGSLTSLTIADNIAADERAAHLELSSNARLEERVLAEASDDAGVRGISARTSGGAVLTVGDPAVTDPLRMIAGAAAEGEIRRHAESFFQGNRYLLPDLVRTVTTAVPTGGHIVDLYAGVGLFSLALAAAGHPEVTAVEGDRSSARDLRQNARMFAPRVHAKSLSVEDYLTASNGGIDAVIVDPPRSGMSKPAIEGVLRAAPPRIVYVSCDPPTLARDARRLFDAGYTLESLRAFDLFPNTAHVETVAVFRQA
jgi:23S rRNA (uracil1939-C5)-methyltransferase